MKFKTVQEAATCWRITGLVQISENWWIGEDHKDNGAVIRFDKSAGWAELFTLNSWKEIVQ